MTIQVSLFYLFIYLFFAFIDVYLRIDSERRKKKGKVEENGKSVETVDFYV